MSFQWLTMRISEEKDRRSREEAVLSRLSGALEDLYQTLSECVTDYNAGFETDVKIQNVNNRIVADAFGDQVEVTLDTTLPGFQVRHGDQHFGIVVGVLPGKNLFYRDAAIDKYLTMEEVTKRILDRALFPKLPE